MIILNLVVSFIKKDRIVNCLLTKEEADLFCAFIRRHETYTFEVSVSYPDEEKVRHRINFFRGRCANCLMLRVHEVKQNQYCGTIRAIKAWLHELQPVVKDKIFIMFEDKSCLDLWKILIDDDTLLPIPDENTWKRTPVFSEGKKHVDKLTNKIDEIVITDDMPAFGALKEIVDYIYDREAVDTDEEKTDDLTTDF